MRLNVFFFQNFEKKARILVLCATLALVFYKIRRNVFIHAIFWIGL